MLEKNKVNRQSDQKTGNLTLLCNAIEAELKIFGQRLGLGYIIVEALTTPLWLF